MYEYINLHNSVNNEMILLLWLNSAFLIPVLFLIWIEIQTGHNERKHGFSLLFLCTHTCIYICMNMNLTTKQIFNNSNNKTFTKCQNLN